MGILDASSINPEVFFLREGASKINPFYLFVLVVLILVIYCIIQKLKKKTNENRKIYVWV